MNIRNFVFIFVLAGSLVSVGAAEASVRVVTTLQDYASIAREIGKDKVEAEAIIQGNADAHHIKPKPSYALMLRKADLFVSTGLDLELWAPVLVNKAGNRKIVDGAPGYVAASAGIELLQKPISLDRSGGDIHIYGNPHIQTSPLNAKVIARNITTGLCKVDPSNCEFYQENLKNFDDRIARKLYGSKLVDLLGSGSLDPLARKGRLISFLKEHQLLDQLGGWLGQGMAFRGQEIICYHKNWVYFTSLFGLKVVDYVEAKPGIPPTARHVADLIKNIRDQHTKVLLAANYFEKKKPEMIAERTGIIPVVVATSVGGQPGIDNYFELIDSWVSKLKAAFEQAN